MTLLEEKNKLTEDISQTVIANFQYGNAQLGTPSWERLVGTLFIITICQINPNHPIIAGYKIGIISNYCITVFGFEVITFG